MTALDRFVRAADSLFSKLGMAATYQPEIGAGLLVTVVPRRPDEVIGFGESGVSAEVTLFDLRVSEVEEPKAGDVIEYDGSQYRITGTPRRDAHRLIWTVEAVAV